ncbi:MAG: EamA family transporter [Clostridium sp.]|uniref:EamA family transporter n=1 Tax=Clostridium sp. TaxID=1506 RepID=UPI0039E78D4C
MNDIILSLKKNKTGIILMFLASLFSSSGQYFWKISGMHNIIFILLGFIFYAIGAVGMIIAFRYGSFSVLHPMMSMSYIFIVLIGYYFLNELISFEKIMGLLLIMLGVALVGVGDE